MNDIALAVKIQELDQSDEHLAEQISELYQLARTAKIDLAEVITFKPRPIVPSTYLGQGRIAFLKEALERHKANVIVFDFSLKPNQIRNLERLLEVRVMERTQLILIIFIQHAQSQQAKLQVALAHLQYMLPRLTRMWTHLSRERGGIGLRGAGEKEIETDRRRIRKQIALLKKKLNKISKQELTKRKQRHKIPRIALVGYTNAGKSSLMNLLTKAEVKAEDQLFATLDTTVRRVVWEKTPLLISDTVGFIRNLPPTLVEAFKSTLAETAEADILLIVTDVSNPFYIEHIEIVHQTLAELNALNKPLIIVFNKIDKLPVEELQALQKNWFAQNQAHSVFTSTQTRQGIAKLRRTILKLVSELSQKTS